MMPVSSSMAPACPSSTPRAPAVSAHLRPVPGISGKNSRTTNLDNHRGGERFHQISCRDGELQMLHNSALDTERQLATARSESSADREMGLTWRLSNAETFTSTLWSSTPICESPTSGSTLPISQNWPRCELRVLVRNDCRQ